ncbi:MAG: hypothetical protein HeimC2_41670 [Candidatus Heimdallarchaeota archaeon LC_2]|nr:MAG: hypothetical protein HeimC2_41670 [Candidatus Heimdallarchaeota archaeon LC_2]
MILFMGNLFLFYTIGNGIILDKDVSGDDIKSTEGVINFSNDFLLDFITMLILSTILFYLMIIKFKQNGLRVLFSFSLFFIYFASIYEIVIISKNTFSENLLLSSILMLTLLFLIPLSINFLYIFSFGIYKLGIRNMGLVISGLLAGRLIAIYLDFTSLIVISIVLIFYDIWNVFKGPLTKLIGKPTMRDQASINNPASFNHDVYLKQICSEGIPVYISKNSNVIIGLGDLFFFSALMYRALIIWDLLGILLSFTAIILGLLLTMKLLMYISPLPGLPIPVSFTLLIFLFLELFN